MPKEKKLRIGELAALSLNPKTIRYYEEIGLLPAPPRTESGYRLYDAEDVEQLRFIGKAKAIGLSLEEIREILAIQREGRPPCEHVLELLDQKLAALTRQGVSRWLPTSNRSLRRRRLPRRARRRPSLRPIRGSASVCCGCSRRRRS